MWLVVGGRWLRTTLFSIAVMASHGVLDAFTDGGLGIAFLWPFDDTRFFAFFRPIPVAPIGAAFLGERGLGVLLAETLLFAPLLAYALWPDGGRRNDPGFGYNP